MAKDFLISAVVPYRLRRRDLVAARSTAAIPPASERSRPRPLTADPRCRPAPTFYSSYPLCRGPDREAPRTPSVDNRPRRVPLAAFGGPYRPRRRSTILSQVPWSAPGQMVTRSEGAKPATGTNGRHIQNGVHHLSFRPLGRPTHPAPTRQGRNQIRDQLPFLIR